MTEQERAAIEQLLCRASFDLTIETAEGGDGGAPRRIKGTANTFGVMRSGRIIHPQALDRWLAAGGGRVPLLALHGQVAGFATIGAASLRVAGGRLRFEAELGTQIPLADEAWRLVSQKLLSAVSLGWRSLQARWVRDDDADLDAHLKRELTRSGVREAYAFLAIEPVELSLVDVPDDAGALLAARAAPGPELQAALAAAIEAATKPLRAAVEGLAARHAGPSTTQVALSAAQMDELKTFVAERVVEYTDLRAAELEAARGAYPDGPLDDADAACGCGTDPAGEHGAAAATGCVPVRKASAREAAALRELRAAVRGHAATG